MLNDWSITGILLLAAAIVVVIVLLCAIGLIVAEDEKPTRAFARAVSSVTGGGRGPHHDGLSMVYYPLMYIGMFLVTGLLLREVATRA